MTEHGEGLRVGTRVGEFEIVRKLGFGGFGITYLARDRVLERLVAVKEYFPGGWDTRRTDGTIGPRTAGSAEHYARGLERFVDEARALARLDHPTIVKVHRVVEVGGTAYMVMEYVEGHSLADELRSSGPLSEMWVRALLSGLAQGLSAVHATGLMHRDIKPANVMLRSRDGSPVLIDFGAARQQVGRYSGLTVVLTPGYAPIEQYDEKGRQGPWTDIYAMGALAYEALSGRVPDEATKRADEDRMPPLREVAPEVSEALAAAVDKALSVNQDDRPQDIAVWRGMIEAPMRNPNPVEPRGHPWRHVVRTAVVRARRRFSAPAVVGAAVLLAAVAFAVGLGWGGDPAVEPMPAGRVFRDCATCPEMVVVPAGSYMMGSPEGEDERVDNERPQHPVTIEAPFAVGVYEVTFEEWDACVAAGGCGGYRPGDQGWGRGSRPVINVNWDDAREYARWLARETGEDYRLPSEAEWEYVARAGTTTARYWGEGESRQCGYANGHDHTGAAQRELSRSPVDCADGYAETAPVGRFGPNEFGLHDVLGNVWEWTEDCLHRSYSGAPSDGRAWTAGGNCSLRVARGGSWNGPGSLRSANRGWTLGSGRNDSFGFRVARTIN